MDRVQAIKEMAAEGYEAARASLDKARDAGKGPHREHYRKMARAFRREASQDAATARMWEKKNAL